MPHYITGTLTVCTPALTTHVQDVIINVTTGQQLADAVAQFGTLGTNMTIQFAPGVLSMGNASFTPYEQLAKQLANTTHPPYASGTLTIQGDQSADMELPVLNTEGRAGMYAAAAQSGAVGLLALD